MRHQNNMYVCLWRTSWRFCWGTCTIVTVALDSPCFPPHSSSCARDLTPSQNETCSGYMGKRQMRLRRYNLRIFIPGVNHSLRISHVATTADWYMFQGSCAIVRIQRNLVSSSIKSAHLFIGDYGNSSPIFRETIKKVSISLLLSSDFHAWYTRLERSCQKRHATYNSSFWRGECRTKPYSLQLVKHWITISTLPPTTQHHPSWWHPTALPRGRAVGQRDLCRLLWLCSHHGLSDIEGEIFLGAVRMVGLCCCTCKSPALFHGDGVHWHWTVFVFFAKVYDIIYT